MPPDIEPPEASALRKYLRREMRYAESVICGSIFDWRQSRSRHGAAIRHYVLRCLCFVVFIVRFSNKESSMRELAQSLAPSEGTTTAAESLSSPIMPPPLQSSRHRHHPATVINHPVTTSIITAIIPPPQSSFHRHPLTAIVDESFIITTVIIIALGGFNSTFFILQTIREKTEHLGLIIMVSSLRHHS